MSLFMLLNTKFFHVRCHCSFPNSIEVSCEPSFDNKKSFWAHSLPRQRHLKSKQQERKKERKEKEKKTLSARQTQFPPLRKKKPFAHSLLRNGRTISSSAAGTTATATVDSTSSSAGRQRPCSVCRLPHDPDCGPRPHRIRVPYLPNAADASTGAHAKGGGGQRGGSTASSDIRSAIAAIASTGAWH